MKPTKLIISAFGPYADKMPVINFSDFEEKNLFLISGDTGSGKTTIFDAICFALFGTTSGTYRDTKNLRSDYAKDDIDSYVDFYFSHQGKNYHILRSPEYKRRKKRGTGEVTVKEKSVFYEEGKEPVEGLTLVNDKVIKLLNINEKQFKQIAMIAQGEFWKLLNAKTDERTKILRTIFQTDGYSVIEDKLKERMDSSNRDKDRIEQSIIQYYRDVYADPEDVLYEELQDDQKKVVSTGSIWDLEGMLERIKEICDADTERLNQCIAEHNKISDEHEEAKEKLHTAEDNNKKIQTVEELETERNNLEKQKPEIDESSRLIEKQKTARRKVYPVYNEWISRKKDRESTDKRIAENEELLQRAISEQNDAKEKLRLIENERPTAESLKKNAEKIKEDQSRYTQWENLRIEQTDLKDKENELNKSLFKNKEKRGFLDDNIKQLQQTTDLLKNTPAALAKTEACKKDVDELFSQIGSILDKRIPDWEKDKDSLIEKQKKYIKANNEFIDKNNELLFAEEQLEFCRAGILASRLKEGIPCPVCGSVHHPAPAILPDHFITEKEVNTLKEKVEVFRTDKDNSYSDVVEANSALGKVEKQLKDDIRACLNAPLLTMNDEPDTLEGLIDCLKKAKEIAQGKIEELENHLIELNENNEKLQSAEKSLGIARDETWVDLNNEKESIEYDLNNVRIRLEGNTILVKALDNLEFSDWFSAEKEMKRMSERAKEIFDNIESAEKNLQQKVNEVSRLEGEKNTLKNTLTTATEKEKELHDALVEAIQNEHFDSIEEMRIYAVEENAIKELEDKISDYKMRVSNNMVLLDQAKEEAKGRTYIDIDSLKSVCEELKQKEDNARSRKDVVEQRIEDNRGIYTKINNQNDSFEKARKDSSTCTKLYKLVKGTTGNGKLTLEQYIQAAGFDSIIAAANRRLMPMSDGQFELCRSDTFGKKSNEYLDLEVMDYNSGCRKPVGNLSGGESFKASLSLALGLSDTISMNLGGIQMDALFIDEGFGTLDRKSIDSAMDVLKNLSGSNKLVGVISHREELMEEISQQIKVKKTRQGSHILIETGV